MNKQNPRIHFMYYSVTPGIQPVCGGLLMNRKWKELTPGFKKTIRDCVKRLFEPNFERIYK